MKNVEEVKGFKVGVKVRVGSKVDKDEIIKDVMNCGGYMSVVEVREKVVPKDGKGVPKIRRFRTKKILDIGCGLYPKISKLKRLERLYDGKRFWYGKFGLRRSK